MNVNKEATASMRKVVGRRIDTAARYLADAAVLAAQYMTLGCPPFTEGKRRTTEASKTPALLEQARVKISTAGINVEAAMLGLMARPVINTATAVDIATTIKGLSKRRREAVAWLMGVRERVSDADTIAEDAETLDKREDLRWSAREVYDICVEATCALDVGVTV